MSKFTIDVPRLGGENHQAEPTDKPVHLPVYAKDWRLTQDGLLQMREGQALEYSDRGNMFDFTTPSYQRGVDRQYIFYNSYKRKTVVDVTSGGVHYRFMGVIRYSWDGVNKLQRLQIYRGRVSSDGITVTWDRWVEGEQPDDAGADFQDANAYTYNSTIASLSRQYEPWDENPVDDPAYIEYSMVYVSSALWLAIVVRDDNAANHSVLTFVKISNIFADGWGGNDDATPEWEVVSTPEQLSGADNLTHDVDLVYEQTSSGLDLFRVVYGYRELGATDPYQIKYRQLLSDGTAVAAARIGSTGGTTQRYGAVICKRSATAWSIGYLSVETSGIGSIKYIQSGSSTELTMSADALDVGNLQAFERSLVGPGVAVDSDYEVVWGYYAESIGRLWFKGAALIATALGEDIFIPDTEYVYRGLLAWRVTGWDFVVKDGVLSVYYLRDSIQGLSVIAIDTPRSVHIMRRNLVVDSDDTEFDDLTFTERELIVELNSDPATSQLTIPCFLSACREYIADSAKELGYITYYAEDADNDLHISNLCFLRNDRGVIGGVQEIVIMALRRYRANMIGATEIVTVLQCDDNRFYERKNTRWKLLKGQMDESNNVPQYTTVVQDRAFLWDMDGVLRAGCGNGSDVLTRDELGHPSEYQDNDPIWYGLIDRYWGSNDEGQLEGANRIRIRERRFTLAAPKPPVVTDSIENGSFVEIKQVGSGVGHAYTVDEPAGTDEPNGEEHYSRFTPTNPDSGAALTEAQIEADSNGTGWYVDQTDGYTPKLGSYINRVFHKYKTISKQPLSGHGVGGANLVATFKQPYIEAWLGFAFRYDDGQISQIIPQSLNSPYILGFYIQDISNDNVLSGVLYPSMLRLTFQLRRWSWGIGEIDQHDPCNPRITDILVFMAEKRFAGDDKYMCLNEAARVIREIKVSSRDPFKDEPWNGDSQWTPHVDGRGLVTINDFVDYKSYVENYLTANPVEEYVGHSKPCLQYADKEKAYLDAYKYAVRVGSKVFYGDVRWNGIVHEGWVVWSANPRNGDRRFMAPDTVDLQTFKPFQFKVNGLGLIGDDKAVVFGDKDIEWGSVRAEERNWRFEGTTQDIGTEAPRAICKVAEAVNGGRFNGLFMLSPSAGGRLFTLYDATPMTNQILDDFIDGRNPTGSARTTNTRQGLQNMLASNAIAIHLPDYRLLLVHFPTAGVTWVKDFQAEEDSQLGGIWFRWAFAFNPTAWCVAPEGYLLMTNGSNIYKWPGTALNDAGTAFTPALRIGNVLVPEKSHVSESRVALDYDLRSDGGGSAASLSFQIIHDDGVRGDKVLNFAAGTYRDSVEQGMGLSRNKAFHSVAIAVDVTNVADVAALKLSGIWFEGDVYKN